MFEKFGEFNSVEELNKAAEKLKLEKKHEELVELAEENGLGEEEALDYFEDCVEKFANVTMAAVGKINVEVKDLRAAGLVKDWSDLVIQLCMEDKELCKAVRTKKKKLQECLGKILKYAFEKKDKLDDRIVKAAGLKAPIYLGVPGKAETTKLIKEYYLGGK